MTSVLLAVVLALAAQVEGQAPAPKPKKPKLDVRATPRMAFSPVSVLFTAELVGGDDVEEYYCPEIEWDWDDGGKSTHEADCPPYETGTRIERRFTAQHQYDVAGVYSVKATFKRAGRSFLANNVRVTVRAGLGDPSSEINP
jgi:PKD repeat protein